MNDRVAQYTQCKCTRKMYTQRKILFKRAGKINKETSRHASTDLILIKRIFNFCIYDHLGYATGKHSFHHNEYSLGFCSKYAVCENV